MRAEILKLRNDPTANAVMAGDCRRANADYLATKLVIAERRRALHRALSWRRRRGAADLARRRQPECQGHGLFPERRQRQFFDLLRSRNRPRAHSLAQVRDVLTARYDVARNDAVRAAQAASATVTPGTLSVAQATGAPLIRLLRGPNPPAAAPISASAPRLLRLRQQCFDTAGTGQRLPQPRRRRPSRRRTRSSTAVPGYGSHRAGRSRRQPALDHAECATGGTARPRSRRAAAMRNLFSDPGRGLNVSATIANIMVNALLSVVVYFL